MNARGRGAIVAIVCVAWLRSVAVATAASAPPAPSIRVAVTPAAPGEDPIVIEAVNRLPFELADVGFVTPESDDERPADFIIGIARIRAQMVVSVTAARPRGANALLRTVALTDVAGGGTDQAATIAIRAVEILRATILQVSAAAAPTAPPAGVRAPPAATGRASSEWAIGAGSAVLQSFRGFGTALGFSAHASLRPRPWLSLEVAAAAPILQADVSAPDGSATIQQESLGAGIRYRFRAAHRVRPSVSLSGGVYHVSVDGHARAGAAVSSGLTAPFAAPAIGVMLAVGESFAWQLQAEALFVQRAPFVIIGGADAGHAGRPLMLVTLEIEWRRGFGTKRIR